MMKSRFASSSAVTVQRKHRKSVKDSYQSFDQGSVFDLTEASQANLLATVIEVGENPRVRIMSDAFGANRKEFTVVFRAEEASKNQKIENVYSHFTVRPSHHGETPKISSKLNVGDLVELSAVLTDPLDPDLLHPWNYRPVSSSHKFTRQLSMPEALCSVLYYKAEDGDEAKKTFRVVMVAPGEAESITDTFGEISRLKSYLGFKNGPINGFVLRGPRDKGNRTLHGVSCYRTRKDDQDGVPDDQVILNFLKTKGQAIVPYISADNPWELIPLYMFNCSSAEASRMVALSNRSSFMFSQDGSVADLHFAHCNLVLDYGSNPNRPISAYFNLSRQKPIKLDAALPGRARPKKIKPVRGGTSSNEPTAASVFG